MITVLVSDLGLLKTAEFTLGPLTVLIGPNNSGKSFLATLAYAVYHSVSGATQLGRHYSFQRRRVRARSALNRLERIRFYDWLTSQQLDKFDISGIDEDLTEYLQSFVEATFRDFADDLCSEIRRCFGTEYADLVRSGSRKKIQLSIISNKPSWKIEVTIGKDGYSLENWEFDLSQLNALDLQGTRHPTTSRDASMLEYEFNGAVFSYLFQEVDRRTFYLPAARSGILQSHKALASFLIQRSPLVGIDQLPEIPRLSGVVADFISLLLAVEQRQRSPASIGAVADFLETRVLQGKVALEVSSQRYPEIYYESKGSRYPLHRTSSMVSEVSPIVLLLRYWIRPGNLLILEEPEAHLHPSTQLVLAKAIVRLVNAGVRVVLTTHSDYFLSEVNNAIKASSLPRPEREKLGIPDEQTLKPNEVCAYLFNKSKDGSSATSKLKVSVEDGIPDDEFARVLDVLYGETVVIRQALT